MRLKVRLGVGAFTPVGEARSEMFDVSLPCVTPVMQPADRSVRQVEASCRPQCHCCACPAGTAVDGCHISDVACERQGDGGSDAAFNIGSNHTLVVSTTRSFMCVLNQKLHSLCAYTVESKLTHCV